MQKKHVLIIGIVGTLLFSFLIFLGTNTCYANATCKAWRNMLSDSFIVTLFFPCVLIFSLITYKMRNEVFRAWLRFSYWWIPLSFILILSASNESGNVFPFPSLQAIFGIALPGLYFIVSLILILLKHFSARDNPK